MVREPPFTLGARYRIEEVLRRGATTTTYAGHELADGAAIVVKELRVGAGWKEHDLFRREVEMLRALRHPGVPRLVDELTETESGEVRLSLVMERVAGVPLSERLARGAPLSLAEVRRILEGILEVLAYLHGLAPPIVHRDVKPSNVLVADERIWLVDFGGVGRFLPFGPDGSTLIGTFGYMAPEQLHGVATPVSDLYAAGATISAILGGCEAPALPRDGLRIDLARIPAAREPLRHVLAWMLEPDPARRCPSAEEALRALREGPGPALVPAASVGPPGPSSSVPALPAPTPPGRFWFYRALARWGFAGFGVASLGLAALLEWMRVFAIFFPSLGDLAMVCGQVGVISLVVAFFIRTRPACRRKLLRLIRRRGGPLSVAEIAERLRLPPERARELADELTPYLTGTAAWKSSASPR